jgi:hypothetical protein
MKPKYRPGDMLKYIGFSRTRNFIYIIIGINDTYELTRLGNNYGISTVDINNIDSDKQVIKIN